ncbi:MAG: hypothetical protein E7168_00970 [Firmicutes bacterium]|nr:hypothetical protein [Bacillota bacterium]
MNSNRAHTMVLEDDKDEVKSFLSDWHQINYEDYIKYNHIENNEGKFIPILLCELGKTVIDIVRHDKIGTIYLPLEMTVFQKTFILSRREAFSKREWSMHSIKEEDPLIVDNIQFSEIEEEIQKKKQKKIS